MAKFMDENMFATTYVGTLEYMVNFIIIYKQICD